MKRYILLVLGLLSVAQTDAVKCEGNHLHFLPDPEKCESYFTCYEGEAYPQICDEGLYFNPVSRQCDYKTAISCVKCPEGKIKKLSYEGSCSKYILCFAGTPLERECSAGFQFNEKLEECDLEKNVNCIDVKCPAVDVPGNPTFIPHPKDCAKYYICLKGTPIEFSCPAGTHYNPNTELCDTIENAKCTIANIFSLWQMKSEDICPPTGAHALPNPESCTDYYMCINGAKIEESCGSGFIFDTITLTCTSDDDGVCILETNSIPKPEDINFECTGTATEFHPDPKDCNAYYICVNGVAFHDYCSRGFIFDIVTKECDVQGNSICICDLNPKLCVRLQNNKMPIL